MRKKSKPFSFEFKIAILTSVMMAGIFNDVLWSFVVSFTSPYIMNYIGGKIGFIFGGVAIVSLIFAILFLPELAGRSLEEVDELFEVRQLAIEGLFEEV